MQPFYHLNRIYGGSSYLHRHAQSALPVRAQLEQTDGAVLLPERWATDIEHVVQSFQIDGSVHTEVRPRALWQLPSEFDVDRHGSVLHRRIDAHYRTSNQAVVGIDRRRFANLHVA